MVVNIPIVTLDKVYIKPDEENIIFFDCTRINGTNRIISRTKESIDSQINNIINRFCEKKIILADDVVFSGNVLRFIIDKLNKGGVEVIGIITSICTDSSYEYFNNCLKYGIRTNYIMGNDVVDQVCERDFYFGIAGGGIMVEIDNKLYKTQATSFKDKNKGIVINNNYSNRKSFIELKVRNKLLANKSGSYIYNQNDKYINFKFNNNKLYLKGCSYSYGMNLSPSSNVSRSIIFENKDTYETYTKNLGSITNGNYKVALPVPDNLDKTRAWYEATIDLSDIPKGEYVIYITTTSNITDIFEMTERLSRSLSDVKATINNKEYSFIINYNRGSRIEMIVK